MHVDEEGHCQLLLKDVIDHRVTDTAITKEQGFVTTKSGSCKRIKTTNGWDLCVEKKDGATDLVVLKNLKNLYPVKLAEYAVCINYKMN